MSHHTARDGPQRPRQRLRLPADHEPLLRKVLVYVIFMALAGTGLAVWLWAIGKRIVGFFS